MHNVIKQEILETIINMQRKNHRPGRDVIYKEVTKDCASNISTDHMESKIKLMIDNNVLENPPSNQNLDSFFILNSNTSTSPSREDIELEQLELRFDPSLATRNQVSFSVETPQIWKQIRKPPEIFDYKDLNAKFVAMKDEIYDLKLEIKKLKKGIEKMNLKSSSNKNYNQNSFFFFLSELLRSKQNIIDKFLNIQSDQLKTNLTPNEKGDNIIDLNNDSITRIVQVFCRCNDIMSYSGSNTLTNIKQTKEMYNS